MALLAHKVDIVLPCAEVKFCDRTAILTLKLIDRHDPSSQRVIVAPHLGHALRLQGVPL
jgi:hypothetical protein